MKKINKRHQKNVINNFIFKNVFIVFSFIFGQYWIKYNYLI